MTPLLLALASDPAPAHELAAAAGATLRFDGSGFAVARDDRGRCGTLDATTLWACGDVCGYVGPQAAARDGARVGACQDWSSWAKETVGDGWAAAGDAAFGHGGLLGFHRESRYRLCCLM